MSNYDGSDDDKIPKSPFAVYRTEADSHFRSAKYNKAIKCYTQALELQPDQEHCLVARSRCYLFEGIIDKALADAESSLVNNPKNPKGLFQKAEVLYFKGEFEKALVLFHRGHKVRPEMEAFRLGIQKCEEAINNSVGNPDTIKLNLDCDLSYFFLNEEKQNERIIKKKSNQEKEKKIERKACNTNPKTVKQLLGELYADRQYLEKLLKDEELLDKKTQNSKEIRELAVNGLNYLDERSDFWQQERPMYARKKYHSFELRQNSSKKSKQQQDIIKYVLSTLDDIDTKQSKSEHKKAIKQCESLLKQMEKWSENDLPNRLDIQANVYCLAGNSYLEMGDYNKALEYHEKDNYLGKMHKLSESTSRSIDNLGRVYAKKGEFKRAIEIWNEKVTISKSALESTWLHHEMGRCYLELADYDMAMEFGEKSIEFAREAEDDTWQMNASILVAQAATNNKKFGAAIEHFDRALEYSKVLKNREAEKAIKKAVEEVNLKIIEEEKEQKLNEETTDNEAFVEDNFDNTENNMEEKQSLEHETKTVEVEEPTNDESNNVIEEKEVVSSEKPEEVKEDENIELSEVHAQNESVETVDNEHAIEEEQTVPTPEREVTQVNEELEEITIDDTKEQPVTDDGL